MIVRSLEGKVITGHLKTGMIRPLYDGHSLMNVPHTVEEILTSAGKEGSIRKEHYEHTSVEDVNKVVLFYIDGVSYDFIASMESDIGFIGRLNRKGEVSPLTAVFPSTTAASCTTLNTGLSPLQHNLIEWELYFHEAGALMYTLPFRAVTSRYSKRSKELDPEVLFKGSTIYSRLKEEGIRSYVLVNRNISKGAYSEKVFKGGTIVPYSYITDCMIQLRNIIEKEKGPAYIYVYIESSDGVGHIYGPETEMYRAECQSISRIIRYELLDKLDPKAADETAVIMTSDHGQVQIDPERTFYLNSINGLWEEFQTHMDLKIPPVGSPRDLFLHIRDERLEEADSLIGSSLGETASTLTVGNALRTGIFGPGSTTGTFLNRSGNLMILPENGQTVWYKLKGQAPMRLKGLHGGMTRDEMIIPFGIARLSHLL